MVNHCRFLGIFALLSTFLLANSTQAAIPSSEREALLALYQSTNGDGWADQTNWLKSPGTFNDSGTECSWYGVTCDSGETTVVRFEASENGLVGPLPSDLAKLVNLQTLDLNRNDLGGEIPPELGSLTKLEYLDLSHNVPTLVGTIPPEFSALISLRELRLNSNRLTGSIPTALSTLNSLEVLDLSSNRLTGPVPAELGDLSKLQVLNLSWTQVSGFVPPELGTLSNLRILDLNGTSISGAIPRELGSLAKLQKLDLHDNQLTGSVPPELGNLGELQILDLHYTGIGGEIPPELGQLSQLIRLSIGSNQLTGSIPSEFVNLTSLEVLDLSFNSLTGILPPELGDLTNLRSINLSQNQLSGPIPSELVNLANLQKLFIEFNQLSGMVPPGLGELTQLTALQLGNNQLTGRIPPKLGNLVDLQYFYLDRNQLNGPIPAELGNLTALQAFRVSFNQLEGEVPRQLMQLVQLSPQTGLDLRNNHLFTDNNALRQFLNSRQYGGEWESSQTLDQFFAHFADGSGLASQVVLFNLNDVAAATGQIEILSDSGQPLTVTLNGDPFDGEGDLFVPAKQLLSLRTSGVGTVRTGSVRVTTDRHVEGVVIFGGATGLAGVGSSPAFSTGFAAPVERNISRGINTGIAVTALGDAAPVLELTLLNAIGNTMAHASQDLVSQGHAAFFLTEINWDAAVDLSDFQGTLAVTASQPVTATVLQTRPGEFVTLPVTALQPDSSNGAAEDYRLYFSQFADGGGAVASQILLLNPSDTESATAEITLRGDSGELLTVDLGGEPVPGTRQLEVGPRALAVLATDGLSELQKGSVTVTSDQPIAGVVIFSGPTVGAAGVGNSVELPEGFVAPMETTESSGINTGVAVMNLEDADQTLDADLLDSSGQKLASAQVPLAALGHTALFVTEIPWDEPVDFSHFEGLLRIRSEGRTAATVIQTRPGKFATMPVAPNPKD